MGIDELDGRPVYPINKETAVSIVDAFDDTDLVFIMALALTAV